MLLKNWGFRSLVSSVLLNDFMDLISLSSAIKISEYSGMASCEEVLCACTDRNFVYIANSWVLLLVVFADVFNNVGGINSVSNTRMMEAESLFALLFLEVCVDVVCLRSHKNNDDWALCFTLKQIEMIELWHLSMLVNGECDQTVSLVIGNVRVVHLELVDAVTAVAWRNKRRQRNSAQLGLSKDQLGQMAASRHVRGDVADMEVHNVGAQGSLGATEMVFPFDKTSCDVQEQPHALEIEEHKEEQKAGSRAAVATNVGKVKSDYHSRLYVFTPYVLVLMPEMLMLLKSLCAHALCARARARAGDVDAAQDVQDA